MPPLGGVVCERGRHVDARHAARPRALRVRCGPLRAPRPRRTARRGGLAISPGIRLGLGLELGLGLGLGLTLTLTRTLTLTLTITKDASTELTGHQYLDVPASQSRDYSLSYFAYKEGVTNLEVHSR